MAAKDKAYKSFLAKVQGLMALAEELGVIPMYLGPIEFTSKSLEVQNAVMTRLLHSLSIVEKRLVEKNLKGEIILHEIALFVRWMKIYNTTCGLYEKFASKL